jgi:DNA repair exonuclease SbcCD ATPase subunit
MKSFHLHHLSITNFKSITTTVEIPFERKPIGLHLVQGRNELQPELGSNGAGKSTLWDALSFCLYGRSTEDLPGTECRPWYSDESTYLTLRFRVGDKLYVMGRGVKPNAIMLNDKYVGQEDVDRLIGLNRNAFRHTLLLGQSQPLFFDLSPSEKMRLFTDVLQLDRWDNYSGAAATAEREEEVKAGEARHECARVAGQVFELDRGLSRAKAQADEWAATAKERLEAMITKRDEYEKLQTKLQRRIGDFDLLLDGSLTELRPLQKQLREVQALHQTRRMQMQQLERELKEIGTATHCPVCKRSLKGTDLEEHRNSLNNQWGALRCQKLPDLKALEQAEVSFQHKSDFAMSQLNQMQPELARVTAELRQLKSNITSNEAAENPFREQYRKLQKELSAAQAQLEHWEDKVKYHVRRSERRRYWVKGFRQVRLQLIETVLEELTLCSQALLPQIGLQDHRIEYTLMRENKSGSVTPGLTVSIFNPSREEFIRWESWSGGERQRLRLVGALALGEVLLHRAGVSPDFEILDEPTQHLSNEGVGDLCNFLADRALSLQRNIFYTDHATVASSRFKSIMTVVKTDHGSKLES